MQNTPMSEKARLALGLVAGAGTLASFAAITGSHALVILAVGTVLSAVVAAFQADRRNVWAAWAGGAAVAALLAWIVPDLRSILLLVSAVEGAGALLLALARYRRSR
ncbi:hypothetical protein EDD39_2911 [Kitasatospora cineracea]|uniref:Uncharacterized protein n=1 Tax=Kitasatospora cineracea TaxID=88074 RepID=A0A8G1XCG2_9ACTN|nr:hypothetical protein EDD39_2911 [Kitasatospora cineracea]